MTIVPNSWDMDDKTVEKHLELRHKEDLGGMVHLEFRPIQDQEYLARLWRAYHDRMHNTYDDYDHDHAPQERKAKGTSHGRNARKPTAARGGSNAGVHGKRASDAGG